MPHQCVHCGKLYPDAAGELLTGCSCSSHFFFYIKKSQYEKLGKEETVPINLNSEEIYCEWCYDEIKTKVKGIE